MFLNEVTGTVAGAIVGGLAYAITRKHHAYDASAGRPPATRAG